MAEAYIALGSNLGDRLRTMREAVGRLRVHGTIEAVSSVYETEPVGVTDQPAFLNAVLRLRTELGPAALLATMLAIEVDLGRLRTTVNGPRTVDLDLLFYDDLSVDTAELVVPHPRLHERAFVLVPLVDIAPDLLHPAQSVRVSELLSMLGGPRGVERFTGGSLAFWAKDGSTEPPANSPLGLCVL